jgi:outer membrane protein TolC
MIKPEILRYYGRSLSVIFFLGLESSLGQSSPLGHRQAILGLDEVVEASLNGHPAMSEAGAVIDEKKGKKLSAIGEFDAKLKSESKAYGAGYYDGRYLDVTVSKPLTANGAEIYTGYRSADGKFPIYDGDLVTGDAGEAQVGVKMPLLRNRAIDERRGEITKADIDIESASNKLISTRLKLIQGATAAYWEVVAVRRQVSVIEDLVKVARERGAQLGSQVTAGDKPRFDLVDNQRAVLKRENELVKVRNFFQKAIIKLSLYYRSPDGLPLTPNDSQVPNELPEPSPEEFQNFEESLLLKEALKNRPELEVVKLKSDQVAVDVAVAENQFLPQLDLNLAAAQDFGNVSKTIDQGELKVGIKVEVPLEYRKIRGKLAAAKAQGSQLQAQRTWVENVIANDIQQSVVTLRATIERVRLARAELSAARELESGEHIRFQHGDSNLIFVNLREQIAAEAALQEIQSLLEYQQEGARLRALLARDPYRQ